MRHPCTNYFFVNAVITAYRKFAFAGIPTHKPYEPFTTRQNGLIAHGTEEMASQLRIFESFPLNLKIRSTFGRKSANQRLEKLIKLGTAVTATTIRSNHISEVPITSTTEANYISKFIVLSFFHPPFSCQSTHFATNTLKNTQRRSSRNNDKHYTWPTYLFL